MPDAATAVTFEDGYEQLKSIVARLDAEDALRAYLTEQKGKLDEIDAGEHLPEFRIVAPSAPQTAELPPVDTGDFGGGFIPRQPAPSTSPATPAGDDIPFWANKTVFALRADTPSLAVLHRHYG